MTRLRQERWLHTRISGGLEDALKKEARRRRLPVSMLVRDVLEGAFDLVEELGLEIVRPDGLRRSAAPAVRRAEGDVMNDPFPGWDELGRAAERFARHVAKEAGRFAKRVEEHFSELAEDVRARRADEPGSTDERAREDRGAADEVRRAFREVRGVLRAVVEGVDDVIVDLFGDGEDAPWARVAASQETKCSGCGATIAAGADAWARRRGHRSQFRCVACGADPGPGVGM